MKASHKRELLLLILLLVVFAVLFVIAMVNLSRGMAVFGLDISYVIEDYIVIALCILSIIRIFWMIIKH